MRFLISLLLTLFFYFLILIFLYLSFFNKKIKKPILIHHAIIVPKIKTQNKSIKPNIKKIKITKKSNKSGSKSNITKGGKVDFNDIFKNVNYSIPSKKIELKKAPVLSRFRANDILKKLKNIKNININISFNTSTPVKKEKLNEIIEKIGNVWYEISDIPGEYATINFINKNGKVEVYILDTNLDPSKEAKLLNKLKEIRFDKTINLTIKFQTKVSK